MLLLLACSISFASEKRETHPITGDPIYGEDEDLPRKGGYHIRGKDGVFKTTFQKITVSKPFVREESATTITVYATPRVEKSEAELRAGYVAATDPKIRAMKGYVTTDEDGTPVFEAGSFPLGVQFRFFAQRMKGFT